MFSTFIAWWLGLYVVVMTIDLFTDPVVNSEFGIGGKLLWFIMGIVLWPISAVTVFIRLTWDQRSIDLMDEWTANEVERLRAERGKGKEEEKLNSFWDDFNNDE